MDVGLDHLRAALRAAPFDGRAAQRPLEPLFRGLPPPTLREEPLRPAAALLYVCPGPHGLAFPLTLRCEDLAEHRGQVSLPGGWPEPGEDLWSTALREAREEVGLEAEAAERLGVLAPVHIPVTHTSLFVCVAFGPAPARWTPAPEEVARLELAPLADLLRPERRLTLRRTVRGAEIEVPGLHLAGLDVWGATAMALSELAERLRFAAPGEAH